MRIGQLARRLGIPPSDILGYLGNKNAETEAGANSRLSDDTVVSIINHFAPAKLSEILQTPAEETVVEVVETIQVADTPVDSVVENVVDEVTLEPVAEKTKTEENPETPIEVIRVSKVELQGLKVLGKIDLPQQKKKEVANEQPVEQTDGQTSTDSQSTQQQQNSQQSQYSQQRQRRDHQKRTGRNDQREWRNPLEAKRLAEAREAEQKKKEKAERQKEKRTNHYYSKVKSVPTKAVRRIEEQTVVEDIETKAPPKGLIGRFLHWLRH